VLALGYFKGSRVFNTLVRVLQNRDEDDIVRSGSVLSLSQLGNRKVLLQLLNVLKNRGDKVRLEVVKALGGFSDELSVKQLMMTIENRGEDSVLRSEAVIAMSQIQSEKVVDNLLSLIQPNCY
jgi:HEAT repeat protein